MAKDKKQQLDDLEQQLRELTEKKKQLEQEVQEEQLEGLIKSTTIGSTVVWKEKGQEKKAEVEKLSKNSVGVVLGGKPKSIRWGKIERVE